MTDHNGRPFTAQNLLGRWALIDFGSLDQPADVKGINSICRQAAFFFFWEDVPGCVSSGQGTGQGTWLVQAFGCLHWCLSKMLGCGSNTDAFHQSRAT
jgi:hypothetical protein